MTRAPPLGGIRRGEEFLTPPPRRASRAVLEQHALGLELVANAVGLLEVASLACRLTGGDSGVDLGIARPRGAGGRPAEPRLGVLLQEAERPPARAQLGCAFQAMECRERHRRV